MSSSRFVMHHALNLDGGASRISDERNQHPQTNHAQVQPGR